jgi:hypothetical protein
MLNVFLDDFALPCVHRANDARIPPGRVSIVGELPIATRD